MKFIIVLIMGLISVFGFYPDENIKVDVTGDVYGDEILINGGFDNEDDWFSTDGSSFVWMDGKWKYIKVNDAFCYQVKVPFLVENGKVYKLKYTISDCEGEAWMGFMGSFSNWIFEEWINSKGRVNGVYEEEVNCIHTDDYFLICGGNCGLGFKIDDISLKLKI